MTSAQGVLASIKRMFVRSAPAVTTPRTAAPTDIHTVEIDPPARGGLVITYAPDHDGDPDAGEIVWTWVPYAERDGRGKDRPVLVIGRRDADRVYAVRLTSKAHDGDRDFLPIGAGAWDSQGRSSWIDIEQVYLVHREGMRREASALDIARFERVAEALHRRYGWELVAEPALPCMISNGVLPLHGFDREAYEPGSPAG